MATRRMFSKTIVNSAKFLRMSQSARLLYYDLGIEADDDGVVEAFAVMRKTGANDDDLAVLLSKGFLKMLNEEDLILFISDWNENNQIQKDRYHASFYSKLLYSKTGILPRYCDGVPDGYIMEPSCIQQGYETDTQFSIDKERSVKKKQGEFSRGGMGEQNHDHEPYSPLGEEQFERNRQNALAMIGY